MEVTDASAVLLEPIELGADAEAELVGVVLLRLEEDERLVRIVPVEEEVDRLRATQRRDLAVVPKSTALVVWQPRKSR